MNNYKIMRKKIEKFFEDWKSIIINSCETLIYLFGLMFMINVLVFIYKFSKDISEFIEIICTKMGF